MRFDTDAAVNTGRFLSALVLEELRRHGLALVVACPGGRNQPLLGALSARSDIERRIAVDERSAGHLALGWLRGRAAAGEPPAMAAVITTSGSAPLLLAPALAEAHAAGLPLVLLSADRPAELHDTGVNQTLDQVSPLASMVRSQFTLPCHAGGASPRDVLSATAEAARVALGPPPGPVHLNLAFREPLAPDPEPLPDKWTAMVDTWAADDRPYTWQPPTAQRAATEAVTRLREDLITARRPLLWVAGIQYAGDRATARRIAATFAAPWLADAGSGLRLAPPDPLRLDHADFFPEVLSRADLVLQLGHLPVSLRSSMALTGALRWLVSDYPGRQDPRRQGGARLNMTPTEFLASLDGTSLTTKPDPAWLEECSSIQASWRTRLARAIDDADGISEAWTVRELARRLTANHGLLLGNSLAVRHADTLADAPHAGPATVTSRGTSGIEGLVAQSVGAARGLARPTVALLGDVTVQHDLGSLALMAHEQPPLLLLVIQNGGGGIFRQLPGARHPDLLDPWLTAHHPVDLCAVATAHGLFARRVENRDGLANVLTDFLTKPEPTLLEAVVPPHGHTEMLAALRDGSSS